MVEFNRMKGSNIANAGIVLNMLLQKYLMDMNWVRKLRWLRMASNNDNDFG